MRLLQPLSVILNFLLFIIRKKVHQEWWLVLCFLKALITIFMFIFIYQRKCTFNCLCTYLLVCLLASFLLYLLTHYQLHLIGDVVEHWTKISPKLHLENCVLVSFLPSLLTYSLSTPFNKRCCWTLTENFSKTTVSKLLKFCQGIFLIMIFFSKW